MKIKNILISVLITSFYLLISHAVAMAMGDEPEEGNYQIKHASQTLENSLLTWAYEEQREAPAGYFSQVINKSAEIQELYVQVEEWKPSSLWSILRAEGIHEEGHYYTIKNIALDFGLLGVFPDAEDNRVQVIDGERYISSRALYAHGGELRDNVLWRIRKDEQSGSYIIRSKRNDAFLSLSNENTFLGEAIAVFQDNPVDSYLRADHPMRKNILWNIVSKPFPR